MSLDVALLMFPGLVIGLTLHEFAHAWSASLLGDDFARRQGRVSLNPLSHLSPLGTLVIFLLPFGWGKPVPVNLYNFKHPRRDYLLTSLAGPAANVLVAAVCLGLMHLTLHPFRFDPPYDRWIEAADVMLEVIMILNVVLATLNLIPIPPLDGSKIWACILPGVKPVGQGRTTWFFVLVLILLVSTKSLRPVVDLAMGGVRRVMPVSDGRLFHDRHIAGIEALAGQNWAEAEALFTKALAVNPRSAECYFLRANARYGQGKESSALSDLDAALALRPDRDYYRCRATVLRGLGRARAAEADEARAKAPDAAPAALPDAAPDLDPAAPIRPPSERP
jgi:Zn-dependent protease